MNFAVEVINEGFNFNAREGHVGDIEKDTEQTFKTLTL